MAEDLLDGKWKDEAYRIRNTDHILEVLEGWTKTHTTDELFESAQLMGLPWAPVHSPDKVISSPHLKARDFFKTAKERGRDRQIKYPGLPYRFSGELSVPDRLSPRVGEDNKKVYKEELGLCEEELASLSSEGVI